MKKNYDFNVTRFIEEKYQDEYQDGIQAISSDRAIELFAENVCDNSFEIIKDGHEWSILTKTNKDQEVMYCIDTMKIS